ncbi:xylose isomerase-like [Aricia agestis]|uniref:xylose isomerase-like n=1 Tax=Aricia agestis TaxID=91739 RepID=UPI001C203B45|nr:xylose isomerase-like [Aricia agestis]
MSYAQAGNKRQKVREGRAEMDYFQGIDKVEYNNMATPTDGSSYRYYCSGERLHGRTMEEWLKYSVSFSDFKSNGSDSHGKPTVSRPWDDNTNSIDNYKRCIKAFLDFCLKLGVKYWTAFDTDLVPLTDNWDENRTNWDEISEYLQEMLQKTHLKILWLAPDLHSHPRYASGASTSHEAATYVHAATQIKKCLEMSQRLNAENFLIFPYREGYSAIFQTDLAKELKLFAKLLKTTAEYKDRLSYKCQLQIMPYVDFGRNYNMSWQHQSWRQNDVHRYMWDVTSCLYFLKNFNLDRHYKACTPPGPDMYMASVYNMLGGVTVTDHFDYSDAKSITLTMKYIVDMGAAPPGGISLKLCPRRDSDLKELMSNHVQYIDAFAKGLRVACNVVGEQAFSKYIQQRYASFGSGFGGRIMTNDVPLEECEEYYKKNQVQNESASSKTCHYELVFQRYLDTCDHV